nr:VPLPA-CTERM sorting domain-containing protein [uncultured Roseibium sp.]
MNFGTKLCVAAALVVGSVSAASAAPSFTVLAGSNDGVSNTADVFAPDFGAFTYAADTMDAAVITPPPGSTSAINKSPWSNTGLEDVNSYFAVGPDPSTSPDPATLTFGFVRTTFELLWGSIDRYNVLEFSLASGGTYSVDPSTVAAAVNALTGVASCGSGPSDNLGCTALVSFDAGQGDSFTSVSFGTTGAQAFEFATAVPLPAAGWLLIGGIGGLAAMRRRKKA